MSDKPKFTEQALEVETGVGLRDVSVRIRDESRGLWITFDLTPEQLFAFVRGGVSQVEAKVALPVPE